MREDLDRLMQENNVDLLLILGGMMHNPAMTWFTGVGNALSLTLIKPVGHQPVLFANVLEAAEAEKTGIKTICTNTFPRSEAMKQSNGDLFLTRAYELRWILQQLNLDETLRVAIYGRTELHSTLPAIDHLRHLMPGLALVPQSEIDVIQQAKLTKDASELARIKLVGERVVSIVTEIRQTLANSDVRDGTLLKSDGSVLTIGDMHARIRALVAEKGLECPEGFIFANAADAGYPHSAGNPEAPIRLGETIVFDFYPCEQGGGYYYDFTRTWCPGFAADEVRRDYDAVKQVFYSVIDSISVNTTYTAYQKQACDMFQALGHATLQSDPATRNGYCHSLGHGIGMQVHEFPIARLIPEPFDELKPGLVFTIEPGLYYPEKNYGIRIENTFYMDSNGEVVECVPYSDDLVIEMKAGK